MEKFIILKIRDGEVEACVGPFDSEELARQYLLSEEWEFHNAGLLRNFGNPCAGYYSKGKDFLAKVHPLVEV